MNIDETLAIALNDLQKMSEEEFETMCKKAGLQPVRKQQEHSIDWRELTPVEFDAEFNQTFKQPIRGVV